MDENIFIDPLVVRFLTSLAATVNENQCVHTYFLELEFVYVPVTGLPVASCGVSGLSITF